MRLNFESAYRNRYGFSKSEKDLIVEIVAVEAIVRPDITDLGAIESCGERTHPAERATRPVRFFEKEYETAIFISTIWSPVIPFLVPRL